MNNNNDVQLIEKKYDIKLYLKYLNNCIIYL